MPQHDSAQSIQGVMACHKATTIMDSNRNALRTPAVKLKSLLPGLKYFVVIM